MNHMAGTEPRIEQKVENSTEQSMEESVDQKVGNSTEQGMEERAEQKVENETEQSKEQKGEQSAGGFKDSFHAFLSDMRSFLTPRAKKLLFLTIGVFLIGSLLIHTFPTPGPDDVREGKGDNDIILHLFEVGGIAALALSILHALRRSDEGWHRDEVIIFFTSCFCYALLFEDMNIQMSGEYAYNKDAWLVVHNTMLVIVFGWCAIAYCIVSTIGKSPAMKSWNPIEKGVVGGFMALSIDIGIDATAFAYGLWYWKEGYFFGVPVTNFVGWFAAVFWFVFSTDYLRGKGNRTGKDGWDSRKQMKARIIAIFPDYGGLLLMVGLAFAFLALLGMK